MVEDPILADGATPPPPDPTWLRPLAALSSALNLVAAIVAGAIIIGMASLIMTEIVLRFFSRSTFMTDSLVAYGVAASVFLALGWTMEKNGMIRVLMLHHAVPKPVQWLFELFCITSAIGVNAIFMTYLWRQLAKDFTRGTMSGHYHPIPLWIPSAFFFVGLALLMLHLLVRLGRFLAHGVPEEREVVL